MRIRWQRWLYFLIGLSIGGADANAYMIAPATGVDQLLATSARVFKGSVVDRTVEIDECGAVVTYTTFKVTDSIKGVKNDDIILLTQLGSTEAVDGGRGSHLQGPSFFPRQSYLVFLGAPARVQDDKCMYEAPVGLDAGTFIERVNSATGRRTLVNGLNNDHLFSEERKAAVVRSRGVTKEETSVIEGNRPVDSDALVHLLKKMAQTPAN